MCSSSPCKRGPLWKKFENLWPARRVLVNGHGGTITNHKFCMSKRGLERFNIEVLFDDGTEKVFPSEESIKLCLLDKFDTEYVHGDIAEMQKNDWWPRKMEVDEPEHKALKHEKACVMGPTGRKYPLELCSQPGDRDPWSDAWDADEEYPVERVIDEREVAGDQGDLRKQYLVKFKGWKLNPGEVGHEDGSWLQRGDWLDEIEDDASNLAAVARWKQKKPKYFLEQQHIFGRVVPSKSSPCKNDTILATSAQLHEGRKRGRETDP